MENKFEKSFSTLTYNINGVKLPTFSVEENINKIPNSEFLKEIAFKGLDKKVKSSDKKKYEDRLKYELSVIEELNFTDYILLVWDVINFCHKNKIPVGMGRGSAAGSLVLFCIDVTKINPITYDLYFERFISKIRAKKQVVDGVTYLDGSLMCDVDLDICYRRRHEVMKYITDKFPNRTCKISTLNSLQGKLLIKECGKIIGDYSEEDVKKVADLIPQIFGKVKDIEEAYKEEEKFKNWVEYSDKNKNIYNTALKLRGLIKNKSVHASAMLISAEPLDGKIPTEINSSTKETVCSYSMDWSTLTSVKLDLLGLKCVTVVQDVVEQLNLKYEDINLNDPVIYKNLQNLKCPHGIFQVEANAVYSACKKIKPKNLEELSGVMAVARPGAMQFIESYSKFTTEGEVNGVHPFFDDILSKTGGLCLYQEQLMKMINKIGFSLDEAETVRKIVGKKKIKEAKEWEGKIEKKIKEKGLDPKISQILWKILEDSANYSFNLSHSISYASLAALTAYLKFKYPTEFFLALLRMTKNEPDPIEEISKIVRELPHFGIELIRPDIAKSDMDFQKEGKNIRFGLSSIKGVADKTIEKLLKFKSPKPNKFSIFRSADESELSIGILTALIQAGAVQDFKQTRAKVVLEAQLWNKLTDREKRAAENYGEENDWDLVKVIKILNNKYDDKGKQIIKNSRLETIKKRFHDFSVIYEKNKSNQALANWYYERKLLGFSPSSELRFTFKNTENFNSISQIWEQEEEDEVRMIGVVKEFNVSKSKKGNKFFKILVKDETGEITVLIFDSGRDRIAELIEVNNGALPKPEDIIILNGKKKTDCIFADYYKIETTKIYTKLGDLRREEKEEKQTQE